MSTVAPNPYSPYADATPGVRHIFPSPIFFPDPTPGALALAACGGMAVVPTERLQIVPAALPEGLCPSCVAEMRDNDTPDTPAVAPATNCRECGTVTGHAGLCALCRQEKHTAWWPTRETA